MAYLKSFEICLSRFGRSCRGNIGDFSQVFLNLYLEDLHQCPLSSQQRGPQLHLVSSDGKSTLFIGLAVIAETDTP